MACGEGGLLAEMLDTAQDYLPRLTRGLGEVAEWLAHGPVEKGCRAFVVASEGLLWVAALLFSLGGHGFGDLWLKYHSVIPQLMAAWESRDTVLVADLLAYELRPLLEELKARLGVPGTLPA